MFSCTNRNEEDNVNRRQKKENKNFISEEFINNTINDLKEKYPKDTLPRLVRGVKQVAALWQEKDGDANAFAEFCINNYISNEDTLLITYKKIEKNIELLFGYSNKLQIKLMEPSHLDFGEIDFVDDVMFSYSTSAHIVDDLFNNKLAFYTILNFPAYTLEEKKSYMDKWTRLEWAYARLGDMFTSRVPSEFVAKAIMAESQSDAYISDYNIVMNCLVDNNMTQLFSKGMELNSHWGLRDELKADYADKENGLQKQRMIYDVMRKIITQDIPKDVINSDKFLWNPTTNQLYKNSAEVKNFDKEPFTRYEYWLKNFKAQLAIDKYSPIYNTYIKRAYDESMEMSKEEIEKLFVDFISAPEIKDVANLIKKRLGRDLEAFDIWYDGFKQRSNIDENKLTAITRQKYPNPSAFQNDIPRILKDMGWTNEKAKYIADKIEVDPARGSGHAWGAEMKGDAAHLRTRILKNGMDYKGYNIAIHELGHNVEQTITLYDIDYYMLKGVPSTAFTEAVAFMFQANDLKLLGQKNSGNKTEEDALAALDNCWSAYEIMGVSLVDMYVWQWLYENPDCNLTEFRDAVVSIATKVWNDYYAPVFGVKDSPILAIYSHLICTPMYLANYPVGHLIEFQVEQYCQNKNFVEEITRMLLNGKVIPQKWMKDAVSLEISGKPTLTSVKNALKIVK